MQLSTEDKQKPFILIAAAAAGLLIQNVTGGAVPGLNATGRQAHAKHAAERR